MECGGEHGIRRPFFVTQGEALIDRENRMMRNEFGGRITARQTVGAMAAILSLLLFTQPCLRGTTTGAAASVPPTMPMFERRARPTLFAPPMQMGSRDCSPCGW